MRKLTKTAAVVASMAVMAMGATVMTSAATEGWVQSGSNWYYYVKGDKVSNQWVLAGEDWYFLDDEGRMVKNTFVRTDKFSNESEILDSRDIHDELGRDDIDDDCSFFYLGSDGKMVTGWREMSASSIYASPNSGSSTKVWYYFGTTGRMYVNEWVESNGKWYALSPNGQMYAEAVVNNDLVDWTDEDYFYMDKNGAMVTGWYKSTKNWAGSDAKVDNSDDNTFAKEMFFYDEKDKWVYGDPDTGVLADEEWKKIDNKWYYFGRDARTSKDGVKDDYLNVHVAKFDLDKLVPSLPSFDGTDTATGEALYLTKDKFDDSDYYDTTYNNKSPEIAIDKFAMLSEKIIAWANHDSKENSEKINYFYLNKNGDALTTWKEIDDDFFICGNDKGELYRDQVANVKGKFYYFNANAVCDYKYLNNTADYAVVFGEKDYESGKLLEDKEASIKFYETTRKNDSNEGGSYYPAEYARLADIKDALEDLGVEYVNFGTRSVKVRSLTESEALLAWAAAEEITKNSDVMNGTTFDKAGLEKWQKENNNKLKLSIYKLRTSSCIEKKSVTFKVK